MDRADPTVPDSNRMSADRAGAGPDRLPERPSGSCDGSPAEPDGWVGGGAIPLLPGSPAFAYRLPDPSSIPVVIAVPHGGRAYPPAVLSAMRHPHIAAPRLEDRMVDLVGIEVARQTGAGILVAHAPRAMIDLNRAADDVDWDMIVGGMPERLPPVHVAPPGASGTVRRARSGLGLVPRRLPALGELWRGRLSAEELHDRVASIHTPYHQQLDRMLDTVRARWGAVLLIDLHSMPPLASSGAGDIPPHVVVGDRFGAACDGTIVSAVFSALAVTGLPVSHNRPYAGGFVLDRHARRGRGVHALQLEIDRQRYLDHRLAEPGSGFDRTVEMLAGLVRRIAATVAACGQDRQRWQAAAE